MKSTKRVIFLNIVDQDGKSVFPVTFSAKNLSRNEMITEMKDDGKGRYMVAFRIGDTYEIDISKEGHTFYNTTYTATEPTTIEGKTGKAEQLSADPILKVELNQLTANTKMVFNNITFEFNSSELNAESYAELERLVKLMKDNPTIKMEISAHTDDIGSDALNMALSNKRAKVVTDYIAGQGIPANSLKSKGFGKTKPIVPNNSDENRAKNRRVEMKIIE
jgi:outer membrane protein OmpA-like peptidoglycan-associated protein